MALLNCLSFTEHVAVELSDLLPSWKQGVKLNYSQNAAGISIEIQLPTLISNSFLPFLLVFYSSSSEKVMKFHNSVTAKKNSFDGFGNKILRKPGSERPPTSSRFVVLESLSFDLKL